MIDGSWVMCTNCKELMEKARQQLKEKFTSVYCCKESVTYHFEIIDEVLK